MFLYHTSIRMAIFQIKKKKKQEKKRKKETSVGEDVKKLEPLYILLMGMYIAADNGKQYGSYRKKL